MRIKVVEGGAMCWHAALFGKEDMPLCQGSGLSYESAIGNMFDRIGKDPKLSRELGIDLEIKDRLGNLVFEPFDRGKVHGHKEVRNL